MRHTSLLRQLFLGEVAVYAIVNDVTGRRYYGCTVDFYERKVKHEGQLRNGKHGNPALQADYDRYGEPAFSFVIIETDTHKQQAAKIERALIEADPDSYNIQHNGEQWREMQGNRLLGKRNALRKDHAAVEKVVDEYLAGGVSLSALERKHKIPRQTIRNYMDRRTAGHGITG